MGAEDIGKKIEEVKAKIDTALEKTDIDDKIKEKAGALMLQVLNKRLAAQESAD